MQPSIEERRDVGHVELLGRNRLIDELLRAKLEIALPVRDRGIDLIAYADLSTAVAQYMARPIQMKAAWTRTFSIAKKYDRTRDLLMAYVWNLGDRKEAVTYAMSHDDAVAIATKLGYTESPSWKEKGIYNINFPGKELMKLLEPHLMTPEKWWQLVTGGSPAAVVGPGPEAGETVESLG